MRLFVTGTAVAVLAFALQPSYAQSIYLDFAASFGTTPSSSYGAAAGAPGHWNAMLNSSTAAMLDVNAQPTSVVITAGPICDQASEDFPTTSGDDAALLDDWAYADCFAAGLQLDITGLRAGTYRLYLYPLGSGQGLLFYGITLPPGATIEGGTSGTTNGLGAFPGSMAAWHVPARLISLPANNSSLHISAGGFGCSGLQLVRMADAATFCGGDQGWCPCGIGQPGAGCPSSFASSGASLTGSGSMQVSSDTLQLVATNVSNSSVTFFQGTTAPNNGLGTVFGDGLRCAGGSVIRLASIQSVGGVAQYPNAGDPSISVRGALPATGGFRTYQVSYRNSVGYCTPSTFNLTNGVAVEWQP